MLQDQFFHCMRLHSLAGMMAKASQTLHSLSAEQLKFIYFFVFVYYLRYLPLFRRCQGLVMQELISAGEDVLVFYNDKASFNTFVDMMRSERNRMDDSSPLR